MSVLWHGVFISQFDGVACRNKGIIYVEGLGFLLKVNTSPTYLIVKHRNRQGAVTVLMQQTIQG